MSLLHYVPPPNQNEAPDCFIYPVFTFYPVSSGQILQASQLDLSRNSLSAWANKRHMAAYYRKILQQTLFDRVVSLGGKYVQCIPDIKLAS